MLFKEIKNIFLDDQKVRKTTQLREGNIELFGLLIQVLEFTCRVMRYNLVY